MSEIIKVENNEITVLPKVLQELRAYQEIRIKADMLEKQIKQELKEAMEEHGVKSLKNEVFEATYVAPTVRNSLDQKRLREELPDIAEEFTRQSNVRSSIRVKFKDIE